MARTNKSQYAILGFLSKRDLSGYDLLQLFKKVSQFYWSESNAQVYSMLKRFEEQGWVTSCVDDNSGERKRCVYSITQAGRDHLQQWLEAPTKLAIYREELLLKLGSAQHLSRDIILKHLDEYETHLRQELLNHQSVVGHIEKGHKGRPDQPYLLLVHDYVDRVLKAKLDWIKHAKENVSL